MANLKNWTVIAKSIRKGRQGLINYSSYLLSQEKHQGQEIIQLSSKKNLTRLALIGEKFNTTRQLNSKKGRPANSAHSFVLSYPFEISNQDFKKIYFQVMFEFLHYINSENNLSYTVDEIKKILKDEAFAVVHRGQTINNHIHIIAPKIFKNQSIDLSKLKYSHKMKLINNKVIHQVMGYDIFNYQLETQITKKKRKPKHQAKQDKKVQELTRERTDEVNRLFLILEEQIKTYTAYVEQTGQENKKEAKRLQTIRAQLQNNNTNRASRGLSKTHINTQTPS